ncbi:Uncharacterised protein [Serratia plymuthica]|uniref:Uncharacterized protein n=1 Tax=Serratia plymuthica TaxID=82996 RepID=A0A2X4X241_SERPL|nr:Uncharacterised protein [Serratia plymuthica]
MSEHFDQLIEQAYRQYRGPAYMRSPAVSCIKVGIRLMDFVVPGPTAAYLGKRFFTPRRVPTRESDKQTMGMASSITYITLSNDKQAVVYHWGATGAKGAVGARLGVAGIAFLAFDPGIGGTGFPGCRL